MDYRKYENKRPYPNAGDYTKYNLYYKGQVIGNLVDVSRRGELQAEYPEAVVEQIKDDEGLKVAVTEYYAEEARLREQFWTDFAEEQRVDVNHPKFALVEEIAWEERRSEGLDEVYSYAERLVEFLR